MSAAEALRRCPRAVFVRPDMARYRERSRTVWAVVASLVERYEQVGIDEGYLDSRRARARAVGRARAARRRCRRRCATRRASPAHSAAAPARRSRRSRATTASRAGSSSWRPGREAAFLAPLPLRALPGIGPRGEERLRAAGLVTIGDLARQDDEALAALAMGKVGRDLRERARGVDRGPSSSRRPIP